MNLGRVFANAVVRRVAYVIVGAVLAWVGIGKAHAHTGGGHATKQIAYEHCEAYLEQINMPYGERCVDAPAGTLAVDYQTSNQAQTSWGMSARFFYTVECATGYVWNSSTKTCQPEQCQNAPDMPNLAARGSATACS